MSFWPRVELSSARGVGGNHTPGGSEHNVAHRFVPRFWVALILGGPPGQRHRQRTRPPRFSPIRLPRSVRGRSSPRSSAASRTTRPLGNRILVAGSGRGECQPPNQRPPSATRAPPHRPPDLGCSQRGRGRFSPGQRRPAHVPPSAPISGCSQRSEEVRPPVSALAKRTAPPRAQPDLLLAQVLGMFHLCSKQHHLKKRVPLVPDLLLPPQSREDQPCPQFCHSTSRPSCPSLLVFPKVEGRSTPGVSAGQRHKRPPPSSRSGFSKE